MLAGQGGAGSSGTGGQAGFDSSLCRSFWTQKALGDDEGKPIWRDEAGFHIFTEYDHDSDSSPYRFSLLTLSPDNGDLVSKRGYPIIPSTVGGSFVTVMDVAHDGQGHFVALFSWRQDFQEQTRTSVLFGNVDSDDYTVVENPAPLGFVSLSVSWVGDAFLVQMVPGSGLASHLFRYAIDGSLLAPPTVVPAALPTDWVSGEKTVDPISHDIWMVHNFAPSVILWGLHADGSPFPQPANGSFFQPEYKPCDYTSGIYPSVNPTPSQTLLTWSGGGPLCLQEVGPDLKSTHPALSIDVPNSPFGPLFFKRSTALRRGERWWVAAQEQTTVWSITLKDWQVESMVPLIKHAPAECWVSKTCEDQTGSAMDLRMLTPIAWKDEVWLGYRNSSQIPTTRQESFRLVRVAPGCEYPSFEE